MRRRVPFFTRRLTAGGSPLQHSEDTPMRRFPRLILAAVFALPAAVGGCGSESKPNPELKVPDVPAGGGRSQPKDKDGKKT